MKQIFHVVQRLLNWLQRSKRKSGASDGILVVLMVVASGRRGQHIMECAHENHGLRYRRLLSSHFFPLENQQSDHWVPGHEEGEGAAIRFSSWNEMADAMPNLGSVSNMRGLQPFCVTIAIREYKTTVRLGAKIAVARQTSHAEE
ncbi:hypothetical protein J6590_042930 [Homalodisca vitripennis]|nr:hypothetical protein J6590_042930 [Homalodisca vitripennis]